MTTVPPRATVGHSEPAHRELGRAGGGDENAESRRIHRVPCRIAVSQLGRSAPLGLTRDLSVAGVFVATDQPLPGGAVVPLVLGLEDGGAELQVSAEVVRSTQEGMGLKFLGLKRPERRRLRKFVGELNSVDSSRETASRLLAVGERAIEPIADPESIRRLLERTRRLRVRLQLIPRERQLREEAKLEGLEADRLVLRSDRPSSLKHDEAILVLHTMEFVSYSFRATVAKVRGRRIELTLPDLIVYSERRSTSREHVAIDSWLVLGPAWPEGPEQRWRVLETSGFGLSFRAEPAGCQLRVGTPLEGATLVGGGGESQLESARIRHITLSADGTFLKVGVEHGARRARPTVIRAAPEAKGPLHRVGRWLADKAAKTSVLWHRRSTEAAQPASQPFDVIRIGAPDAELVGLLNATEGDDGPLRCPLVVVVPGFAGRKEQMGALARTLVHTFACNHQDVAVLRFDGSNNLGESWKHPECREHGNHTLRFTVSGAVEDLRRVLAWARDNDRVEPTSIILVSVSFASVPVRHFLATEPDHGVGLWVSYMGAADARDSVHHVSGHLDLFENARLGRPNGIVTLLGCLADGDLFLADLIEQDIGTLEAARAEMARLGSDVFWIVGRQDGFMDPRRAHDLMTVEAPGGRELLEVDAGHIPRSSDQALRQFTLVAERVFRQVHGISPKPGAASVGWMWSVSAAEWDRVRRPAIDRSAWWARYLLGEGGPGFDVLELSPHYRSFAEQQVRLLDPRGERVLELGAGTGNLARRIVAAGPSAFTCTDLVPEVLEVIRRKVGPDVELSVVDVDGSPRSAMGRWIRGDLAGMPALARRIPGLHAALAERIAEHYTASLHAALIGRPVDPIRVARDAGLSQADAEVVADLSVLARLAQGQLDEQSAAVALRHLPARSLEGSSRLPWADGSFDRVVLSLVLSYLAHPEDLVRETLRVLAPGGVLVLSSMRPDADSSGIFLELVHRLETASPEELPAGLQRPELLDGARAFMGDASDLMRMEEEGLFCFFSGDELAEAVQRAGFVDPEIHRGFGDAPQAVIVRCTRP